MARKKIRKKDFSGIKITDLKSFGISNADIEVQRISYGGKKKKTYNFTFRDGGEKLGSYTTEAYSVEKAKKNLMEEFGWD